MLEENPIDGGGCAKAADDEGGNADGVFVGMNICCVGLPTGFIIDGAVGGAGAIGVLATGCDGGRADGFCCREGRMICC